MNFHLPFRIAPFPQPINYKQDLLLMGSCFAEEIGGLLQENKFKALINPHGILYNPASIAVALRRYLHHRELEAEALKYANDCFYSPEHHSRFSNPDQTACLQAINNNILQAHQTLKNAEWLFITFGSAFVYRHTASNTIVGNCHKLPQKTFTKQLLTIEEMVADYRLLLNELLTFNPVLKIIFTVSPVRYVRDGMTENTRSKARLFETVHALVDSVPAASYFPAYELVMDDLRDYRFYKTDLVHPSEQAVQYVFEKLKEAGFDAETQLIFDKIQDIRKASTHRPFHSSSTAHQQFKTLYSSRCLQLQTACPFLDLKKEIEAFK